MTFEVDGKVIETTPSGFLVNLDDWSKDLANKIAIEEGIELTDKHWDLINFLRDEYINNNGNQPNTRKIVKAMSEIWGQSTDTKSLYDLFPRDPSKQAGRIGGLPESRRKGGY
jgi:tRNA 2-thiouridine synthesizing protein E